MKIKETNEHRLYKKLTKFLLEWLDEENKTNNRKPFQSEIIGALEMVKMDLYLVQSAERVLSKKLVDIFSKLDGKEMSISKDGITVVTKDINLAHQKGALGTEKQE